MKNAPRTIQGLGWLLLLTLVLVVGLATVPAVHAAGSSTGLTGIDTASEIPVVLEVPILNTRRVQNLPEYIKVTYEFIVAAIAVLAVVKIMVGGISWVTAGGNAESISDAKSHIFNALIGLGLALMSYIILAALNPALVGNEFSGVPKPVPPQDKVGKATERCKYEKPDGTVVDLVDILESVSDELKPFYSWTASSSLPCVNSTYYQSLVEVLSELADPGSSVYGMKLVISSGFRSTDEQGRLYTCYTDFQQTGVCASGCGSCNLAAAPPSAQNPGSSHNRGYALDMSWIPSGNVNPAPYVSLVKAPDGTEMVTNSWHNGCAVAPNYGNPGCFSYARESLEAFDFLMNRHGLKHLCKEWWHFQPAGTPQVCNKLVYTPH